MSYADNPYRSFSMAAQAAEDERADFIRKTYLHLAGAVFAFTGLEAVLLNVPGLSDRYMALLNASRYSWFAVLGAFMFVSYFAEKWARSAVSPSTQYMGLGLYVAAEAVLFLPLLYIAQRFDPNIIPTAGVATLVIYTGLTAIVFLSGRDFSFLRSVLWLAGLVGLGAIVVSAIFPQVVLGIWFSAAMVAFASGYILYDTSNVLHHYRIGQHVAAALALFASVALLFWYILRIVMALSSRR